MRLHTLMIHTDRCLRYSLLLLIICMFIYYTQIATTTGLLRRDCLADRPCTNTTEVTSSRLNCTDPGCRERLSEHDRRLYNRCLARVKRLSGAVIPRDNGCTFLSGASHPAIALISFPGSGNTWIRQLLEAATGICTGSTMCDMSLRFAGFTGENINSGSVLVVKTHTTRPNWTTSLSAQETGQLQTLGLNESDTLDTGKCMGFQSAIIIIRNPFDSLVAEWSRRVVNDFKVETTRLHAHTKEIDKKYFGNNKMWDAFVHYQGKRWQEIIQQWLIGGRKDGKKVLVVHYEELKKNRATQIKRMLDFLELASSRRISQKLNIFQRQHLNHFKPYTRKQETYVASILQDTMRDLEHNHMSSEVNLTQYLYSSHKYK